MPPDQEASTVAARGGDHLDRLRTIVDEVRRAMALLEELVYHPSTRRDDTMRHSALVGSSPSWNAQAAYLVLDIRRRVRGLEEGLRDHVTDTKRPRGGSDRNTSLALDAIIELAHAVGSETVRETLSNLSRWLHQARTCLGEVEPLSRLPRLPGQPEPRCPWCQFPTLRYQPYAGIVRCVNPECLDDDDRRPLGRIELGPYSGEAILAWGDGSTGIEAIPA